MEGVQKGGVGAHGNMIYGDRDGQRSAGRTNIGQEINEGDRRTTDDQTPGSGRAKLGRKITMEWS